MRIIKKYDDPQIIEEAVERLSVEGIDEEYTPDFIKSYNSKLPASKSTFANFSVGFRKFGWLAPVLLILINFLFNSFLSDLIRPILVWLLKLFPTQQTIFIFIAFIQSIPLILIFAWIVVWFSYWLAPLKHCDHCNRLYSRNIVYEKYIPDTCVNSIETRTESKDIRDKYGKVIGTYDQEKYVEVETSLYYTVYMCKKCKHAKIEIIKKQVDL